MERSIAIRREWAIEFVGRRRLSGTNVTTSFRNARIEQNSLFRLLIRPQATFCPHLGVVFSIARHLVKGEPPTESMEATPRNVRYFVTITGTFQGVGYSYSPSNKLTFST